MTAKTANTAPPAPAAPDGDLFTLTGRAFDPVTLIMDANARTGAEDTIDKAFVGTFRERAKDPAAHGCGNFVPVIVKRLAIGGDHTHDDDGTVEGCPGCFPDEAFRVRTGHRRVLACLRAGVKVLGLVAGDEGDPAAEQRARLVEQFNENYWRTPLTHADTAQLMLDLDLTDTKTARALGLGKDAVAAYRKVAGSELAVKALDRYEWLTLDQAAALDEFAGDQDALTGLLRAAKNSPASFEDTLERLRARRDRDASRAATVAQLAELGYRVKDDTRVAYYLDLDNLRKPAPEGSEAEDGGPIDPAEHAACEYAAVTIDYDYAWESDEAEQAWNHAHPEAAADGEDDDEQPDPMFDEDGEPSAEAAAAGYGLRWVVQQHYCEDPAAAGHVSVYGNRQEAMTPAEPGSAEANAEAEAAKKEAERESRRRLLRRNREWRAAGERRVRRLKVVLAQKDLPATSAQAAKRPDIPTAEAATRLIAGAIARRETEPNMMGSGHGLACELLGLPLAKPGAAEGYTVPLDAREVIQAAIDQASAGAGAGDRAGDDPGRLRGPGRVAALLRGRQDVAERRGPVLAVLRGAAVAALPAVARRPAAGTSCPTSRPTSRTGPTPRTTRSPRTTPQRQADAAAAVTVVGTSPAAAAAGPDQRRGDRRGDRRPRARGGARAAPPRGPRR